MGEYLQRFNQLARYALADVARDEDRQERFMEGLNDEISVQLISQYYTDFQRLVNKAFRLEAKQQEMENRKRRMAAQKFNSGDNPSLTLLSLSHPSVEDSSLLHPELQHRHNAPVLPASTAMHRQASFSKRTQLHQQYA